jgi:hypothetical protein
MATRSEQFQAEAALIRRHATVAAIKRRALTVLDDEKGVVGRWHCPIRAAANR